MEVSRSIEPAKAARAARLRYTTDRQRGFRRRRAGHGFQYLNQQGSTVRGAALVARFRALAIPPAWTDVWISADPVGHLQATGKDARGRKQYRYHPRWRTVRDATKFLRMLEFGAALPAIRRRVRRDLRLPGLPRDKILAVVVRLLETTLIRVGNEEYAQSNGSYGLTTLRYRHVRVSGKELTFRFPGKGGKRHDVTVSDPRLARVVRRCRELPGQELFQYLDLDGEPHPISSSDVNAYLAETTGDEFTAKDFRTWAGTLRLSRRLGTRDTGAQGGKAALLAAVKEVAEELRNTPAICRRCYVHPAMLAVFEDDALHEAWRRACDGTKRPMLSAEESALLRFLKRLPAGAASPATSDGRSRAGAKRPAK